MLALFSRGVPASGAVAFGKVQAITQLQAAIVAFIGKKSKKIQV